jgi:hypothetical protein
MIPDKQAVAKSLEAVPGPLPWYGRTSGCRVYALSVELEWIYSDEICGSLLVERSNSRQPSASGCVFGVAKSYTYVKNLPGGRFTLWWQERLRSAMGDVQFRVYDANELGPLDNWRDAWEGRSKNLIGAPETASFSLPSTLQDGINRVCLPAEFTGCQETLVLVNRAASGIDICIWSIDSLNQTICVLPQKWWNQGNRDFGYEWITRVAREQGSGVIVGDGIRMGQFVLDCSGLERWDRT